MDPYNLSAARIQQVPQINAQPQQMQAQAQPSINPAQTKFYEDQYNAYAGHPTMQNQVVAAYYKAIDPSNQQNSLATLLGGNLGGQQASIQPTQPQSNANDPYGLSAAKIGGGSNNTQTNTTTTTASNTPQQEPQGNFGFGNGNGELFGQGGLVDQLMQPVKVGVYNPIAQILQAGGGVVGDLAQGKDLGTVLNDPSHNIANQKGTVGIPLLGITQQQHDDYAANPLLGGIKSGAALASAAIPGIGVGGNIAKGAISSALFGAGTARPGQELQQGLTSGVIGGLTAGILPKILGALGGNTSEIAKGIVGDTSGKIGTVENELVHPDNLFAKALTQDANGATVFNPEALSGVEQKTLKTLTSKYVDAGLLPSADRGLAKMEPEFMKNLANAENLRLQNGLDITGGDLSKAAKIAGKQVGQFVNESGATGDAVNLRANVMDSISNNPKGLSLTETLNAPSDIGIANKYTNNILKQVSPDFSTIDAPGLQKITELTSKDSQTYGAALNNRFLNDSANILKDPELRAAYELNHNASKLLTKNNPALQTAKAQYAFLNKSGNDVASNYVNELSPNNNIRGGIGSPVSKGNIVRQTLKAANNAYDKGLLQNNTLASGAAKTVANASNILGKVGSAINNLPNSGIGTTLGNIATKAPALSSIIGSTGANMLNPQTQTGLTNNGGQQGSVSDVLKRVGLQDNGDSNLPDTLPTTIEQTNQKAQQVAAQLIGAGYSKSDVQTAFQLNPQLAALGDPFKNLTTSSTLKAKSIAGGYNQINDLIEQIGSNKGQFGLIGGGAIGDTLNMTSPDIRNQLKANLSKLSASYKLAMGTQNITHQVNMQMNPQELVDNLRAIQSEMAQRYQDVLGAGNNATMNIGL